MIVTNIQRWAAATPEKIAYQCTEGVLTYGNLYKRAARLASYVRRMCTEKAPVIIYGHKQLLMPVCMVACMIAGIPYVPVDSSLPQRRLQKIIDNTGARSLFAVDACNVQNCDTINTSDLNLYTVREPLLGYVQPDPQNICYIIFTSGSTGNPKGVQITYDNLQHYIHLMMDWIGAESASHKVVLNQANFSFDLSVADLFYSFFIGATEYVLEKDVQRDYARLSAYLQAAHAQFAVMTPSFAAYCLLDSGFCAPKMPDLKTVFFCGESLKPKLVRKLWKRFPALRIINAYGPTETTVAVCAADISPDMLIQAVLPVSAGGDSVQLVDTHLKLVADGENGEILIVGVSVGSGYLNSDNQKFIQYNGMRGYLTGDIGTRHNGFLYCLGRSDQQVKRGGYRIDLEDIEHNLNELDLVENSAVIASDFVDTVRITAFVQPCRNADLDQCAILDWLKTQMPMYLLPDRVVVMKALPQTANRKIDKQILMRRAINEY